MCNFVIELGPKFGPSALSSRVPIAPPGDFEFGHPLEPWKECFLRGCLELSVYLWCALPLPPHLPTQSSFLELFEKKLWKENGIRKVGIQDLTIQSWNCRFLKRNNERKMGWEKKESMILPFKVQSCRFLNRNAWKEKEMRKEGIHDLTIQSSVLQVFEQKPVKGKGDEKSIEK